jgi:hypothetical protein
MANKRSLLLNNNWDIGLTPSGELATCSGLYCDAQNVANMVRLFTNDAYLAQNRGVPHFTLDLGKMPIISEVRARYRKAAKQVENISEAVVEITGIDPETRTMRGIITSTTLDGQTVNVEI